MSGLAAEAVDWIVNSIYGDVFPDSEDCTYAMFLSAWVSDVHTPNSNAFSESGLTINIWKPSTATPSSKLPVIAVSISYWSIDTQLTHPTTPAVDIWR